MLLVRNIRLPLNCPAMTVGLPPYGQHVSAVVSSQLSSAPQDGQQ